MAEQAHPEGARPFTYRGVAYDTGTTFATFQGALSRNVWSTELMQAELSLLSELNANSVSVYGSDLGRLSETATAAAERGLHVFLDPRLPDHPQKEVIDHVAEVAKLATSLRQQGADIDLTVGAVHVFFTPEIFPGQHYNERLAAIYFDGDLRFGHRQPKTMDQWFSPKVNEMLAECAPRLNDFLGRAAAVARQIFPGRLAYSAAPWEPVDWTPFDFIGLMYYLIPSYLKPEQHLEEMTKLTNRWNRPILISGFGTGSYDGAPEKGFFSWDIVDRSGPVPRILEQYVRDEGVQAAYYRTMLGIYEQAGVYGVAPSDLVHPTHPHSPDDPSLDLDMCSMCLVKSIRTDITNPNSPYRREKKQSFQAVADYYARVGAREAVSS